jgi:carboxylesterase type B
MGSASMPEYNGEAIAAKRGVMVVSINYRTNGESL